MTRADPPWRSVRDTSLVLRGSGQPGPAQLVKCGALVPEFSATSAIFLVGDGAAGLRFGASARRELIVCEYPEAAPSLGAERVLRWSIGYRGPLSTLHLAAPLASVFGPSYWLARCDGFPVVGSDGSRGEVVEIVEVDGNVAGIRVRLEDDVQVLAASVLDIDPVERLVSVDWSNATRR
jgi:hypothetical protein